MKEPEKKGFRVEACFRGTSCSNRTAETQPLMARIMEHLEAEDLGGFLREQVGEPLKYHHALRVSISGCPNACSQPQIKDIGILGARIPAITDLACSECGACVQICKEQAIILDLELKKTVIDYEQCVKCGQCIKSCPTGTLEEGEIGFRIQLGGKLGRHPQLGRELPGLFNEDQVVAVVKACIALFKNHGRNGERFGSIVARWSLDNIINRIY